MVILDVQLWELVNTLTDVREFKKYLLNDRRRTIFSKYGNLGTKRLVAKVK